MLRSSFDIPLFFPSFSFQIRSKFKKLKQATKEIIPELKPIKELPYLITYTSGTLSEPKGVLHTSASLNESIQLIAKMIRSDQKQIMASHLPHFMLIGACAGVSTKLWDITWSPEKRCTFIEKENISTLFAPPTEYLELVQYCEANNKKLPQSLSHILIGSAPVHQSFLQKLIKFLPEHTRVTCLYGMTENLVVATIDGREKAIMETDGDPLGKPMEGINMKIAEDGEILIKSNQLFSRYWHLKERPVWHQTGDLGYLDDNGVLILKGRKKEMIIRKNFNLYPALYIPTILKINGIEDAVLIGRYNEQLADEEVHLFVEGKESLTTKYIRKQLESGPHSIDKESWPDFIHLREIPRKGRQQKIDRNQLREAIKV